MIAMMIGIIVIPVFLNRVSTGLFASRNYGDMLEAQYACDAGAEHAIWNLINGGLADMVPNEGDSYEYTLDEQINGENVTVLISNDYNVLAWDNFEGGAGVWNWGEGWLDDWAASGTPEIISSSTPKEGTYHTRMNNTDSITRSIDLSQALFANVRFWYKQTNNFDGGGNPDYVYLEASNDGSTWQQVRRWSSADNNFYRTYRFVSLSLTSFGLSDTFYLRFRADTDSNEYFYIDDLDIVWMATGSQAIVEDDFESGDFAGGYGWLNDDPWSTVYAGRTTNAVVVDNVTIPQWPYPVYESHGGIYQAQLRGNYNQNPRSYAGVMSRGVDLSGQSVVHLRFWARQINFGNRDRLYVDISTDGGSTWQNAIVELRRSGGLAQWRITGSWKQYDVNLSGYSLTSNFMIRFRTNLGNNTYNRYIWIDDVTIKSSYAYYITVIAGDRVLKAVVDLVTGEADILAWYYES